ncbi:neural proliferation differentiation and control protein 1 isoform X2 [Silurus meridionalis]|uniref:neural proliferation differentiation and control protein 1 isoform X2 n=1 Tax=Silurus meridionalis TaxID=175797 RepID=UPI001EEBA848|nr:neural proliferation differentiation and control protein 1 isoform X2 [Silurus meridionalis]XP_046698345.1 neural proliferation differentiation and control protein 1 isoform X2 [Silurus meridionalis]
MPSSRRGEKRRVWAAILLIGTITISTTMAVGQCPRSLDCAREGRNFCQPGSSQCGPCLAPLIENKKGKCVVRRRNHIKEADLRPELDEEIDFLSSIITKHRESEMKHTAPSQPVSHIKDDSSWPRGHNRVESSPSYNAARHPVTHTLTTLSTTTSSTATTSSATSFSPNTINPLISAMQSAPLIVPYPSEDHFNIVTAGVCLMVASVALVLFGVCWVRMQRGTRLAQKVDYPAFGVMSPHSYDSAASGDKNLAQSAQMYHYQHQKQQMLSLKQRDESKIPESAATSDEENEDGDFTVYECPGLAPTGEMEVKNPLFDDSTLHLHLDLQKSYN